MTSPRKSQGIALVMALLIVALATVAAVSFATQQQLDVRRTGNLIDGDQAWAYATGGEDWAALILRRDAQKTQIDHLGESWAQNLPPIDLPGGYMVGKISDAHLKLNLNNVAFENGQLNEGAAQMQRLLQLLELDPNLVYPIVDWIDPDINPTQSAGAEDDYYSGLQRPYRTANQYMTSASELRLIKGFDEKIYKRIAPYVTALSPPTSINVNTAPAEVLATLAPGMTLEHGVALVKLRQGNPFKDSEFISRAQTVVGPGINLGQANVTVQSQYFEVYVETRIGYGRAALTSLLSRVAASDIQLVRRAQGFN
jgi:general secretion pathway protein K